MKKLNVRKDAGKLSLQNRTFFMGNKNEILYYTDWQSGRNYARARFDFMDSCKTFEHDVWFQLNRDDIKDEDALTRTEMKINAYFGYFGKVTNPFEL